jgi:hypothetical protein
LAAEALPSTGSNEALPLPPEEEIAAPLGKAFLAFASGDYAECVEWLKRLRATCAASDLCSAN